jgi:hypothetical protein
MRKKWSCGFGLKDLAFVFEHERRHREMKARFDRRRKLKENLACDYSINRDYQRKEGK